MLCVEHRNCLTAQNNQNLRFRTERTRKGLTERRKKKMFVKVDVSHVGQHPIFEEKLFFSCCDHKKFPSKYAFL